MKARWTRVAVAIFALASALIFSTCGESESRSSAEDNQIDVVLDASPGPNHAGIYVAKELGYFKDAGIDVTIQARSDRGTPIEQVSTGQADLAIASEPAVIRAKEKGQNVVTIASISNRGLTSLIWLGRSEVDGIGELRNRAVAIGGTPLQVAFLEAVLAYDGVDIDEVKVIKAGSALNQALLSGRVEASLGGFRNTEGIGLRVRGADPVVDPVTWIGVPWYAQLVLITQPERLEEKEEAIRLFVKQLIRGTEAAKQSRRVSTKAVLAANPGLEPKLTWFQVDDTLPLLSATGELKEHLWEDFIVWMEENDLIDEAPTASDLITNEYLPGDIPD